MEKRKMLNLGLYLCVHFMQIICQIYIILFPHGAGREAFDSVEPLHGFISLAHCF